MQILKPRVGIVVPTIGGRPEYLPECLESIRKAVADPTDVYILMIGRKGFDPKPYLEIIDEYVDEADPNLAAKINQGLRSLPSDIEFFNWIGDDDLLAPGSLEVTLATMTDPKNCSQEGMPPVLVYGGCEYIDPGGQPIWNQRSGNWAVALLRFGPQLIPQPGALYRRDAFEAVGGLSTELGWAFDFNLFLNLCKIGKAVYVPKTLARFRWHPGSLSVSYRRQSVKEASLVRVSNLPKCLRSLSPIWEFPVREATYWVGLSLSKRLQ